MQSTGLSGRARPRLAGDQGASLVEYALLVALITLVCVSSVRFFQGVYGGTQLMIQQLTIYGFGYERCLPLFKPFC